MSGFNFDSQLDTSFGVVGAPNSNFSAGVKTNRPSFKGSLEDLVTITNFKRFKRKGSSSKYKGVFYVKKEKKYRAQICLKGKKKYVGTFKNDRDAAIARDQKIREMFGEVEELLNFPIVKPEDSQNQKEGSNLLNTLAIGEEDSRLRNGSSASASMRLRSRLSNLTRFSSSASLPFISFGGINNVDDQENQNNQHHHQQTNFNFYNLPEPNSHAGYYNSFMNFTMPNVNVPEMLPGSRQRTMLAKRFSSNDSCFSFTLQAAEALNQSMNQTMHQQQTNSPEIHHMQPPTQNQDQPPTKRMKLS